MSSWEHGYQPPETCTDCIGCPFRQALANKYGGWLSVPIVIRAEVQCEYGSSTEYATSMPVCGDPAGTQQRIQTVEHSLSDNAAEVNE